MPQRPTNMCLPARLTLVVALAAMLAACGGDKGTGRLEGERVPIITTEGDVQVDPVLETVPVSLPRPYANQNWGQDGGNPRNLNHHLAVADALSLAWRADIGRGSDKYEKLTTAPVVWGNTVFTMDVRSTVSAFSTSDGSLRWRATLDQPGEKSKVGYGGGIAYWGGRIFATSGYGFVAALDASTGSEIWRTGLGVPLRGSPTVANGRVFAITQDNQLFVLNADTGEVQWSHFAIIEQAEILGASSPAVTGDTVVAGFSSGELYALRVENGLVLWQDTLSRTGRLTALATLNDIDGNPVIHQGRVIAGSHSGRTVAIDFRTGQRVWEINLGTIYTPWVAGSYMYVVGTQGSVVALSASTGRVRWISQLQRFEKPKKRKDLIRWAGPALAGDRLFVVSSHGYLLTLSPYTGEILSGVKMPDSSIIAPVVADGTVYVLTQDGDLLAYR